MNILNGIDEADRRIREQERIAMRYTRMSNNTVPISGSDGDNIPNEKPSEDLHDPTTEKKPNGCPPRNDQDIISAAAEQIAAALNVDGEKLLILSLIVILGSEGADIALLAALAYLLI